MHNPGMRATGNVSRLANSESGLHRATALVRTSCARATLPLCRRTHAIYRPPLHVQHARQFELSSIVITEAYEQQAIYLQEIDGSRHFPLLVGIFEATSIDRWLNGFVSPRPLTHDAWADSIRLLGAEVQDVVIDRLSNQTYYASISFKQRDELQLLDLRPSDAFMMALITDCPIFVSEEVLNKSERPGGII
jgi:uncharacterized protein